MTQRDDIHFDRDDLELLFAEIGVYLEVVDAFRREGREPTWRRDVAFDAHA